MFLNIIIKMLKKAKPENNNHRTQSYKTVKQFMSKKFIIRIINENSFES